MWRHVGGDLRRDGENLTGWVRFPIGSRGAMRYTEFSASRCRICWSNWRRYRSALSRPANLMSLLLRTYSFTSLPGWEVNASVYRPKTGGPWPGVVCPTGHSRCLDRATPPVLRLLREMAILRCLSVRLAAPGSWRSSTIILPTALSGG